MFITHDFGVVAEIADVVTVMYAAQAIETADVFGLFETPTHPYTEALLHAVPSLDDEIVADDERGLPGVPPNPTAFPRGCRFAPRCAHATDLCRAAPIELRAIGTGRLVRCVRAEELSLVGRS
jgi:oligopeptide/dipeptide ABC transporter ATP-binding protein